MFRAFATAGRELLRVARGASLTHRHLRDRLMVILVVTAAVDVVCALVAYGFEHDAPRTQITGLGSALFFTTTQLLTVSSSLVNPLTTGGRVLDVLMEVYAITVVATLAGATGSFFHFRSLERRGG